MKRNEIRNKKRNESKGEDNLKVKNSNYKKNDIIDV
jgi:hypothetical protein